MHSILAELSKQQSEATTLRTGLASRGEIINDVRKLREKLAEFLSLLIQLRDIKENILKLRNAINAMLTSIHSEMEMRGVKGEILEELEEVRDAFIRSSAHLLLAPISIHEIKEITVSLLNLIGAILPKTKGEGAALLPQVEKLAKRIDIPVEGAPQLGLVHTNPQKAIAALLSYLARCYAALDLLQTLLTKIEEIERDFQDTSMQLHAVVGAYDITEGQDSLWERIMQSLVKVREIASSVTEHIDADKIEDAKLDIIAIGTALNAIASPERIPQAKSLSLLKALERPRRRSEGKNAAKRKLREGIKNLKARKGEEAFEDFAAVKFYLMDEDCYTETLLNALDKLLDAAWRLHDDPDAKINMADIEKTAARVEELIDNPRGEKATPPVRVKTVRDARLWEAAKRIVNDNYKGVDEDSKRYWALVSRIFTRMRLRLGGLQEEVVEKIVEELQEEEGKLPPAGEGSKGARRIAELKEKVREMLLKALSECSSKVKVKNKKGDNKCDEQQEE